MSCARRNIELREARVKLARQPRYGFQQRIIGGYFEAADRTNSRVYEGQ